MKKTLYLLSFTLLIAFMVSCDKYEIPEEVNSIPFQGNPEDTVDIPDDTIVIPEPEEDILTPFKSYADGFFIDFQEAFIADPTADSLLRIPMLDSTYAYWAYYNSGFIDGYFASIVGAEIPSDSLIPKFLPDEVWDTLVVIYPAFFQAFLNDIQIDLLDPGEAEDIFNERCNVIIDIVMNGLCDAWIEEYFGRYANPRKIP